MYYTIITVNLFYYYVIKSYHNSLTHSLISGHLFPVFTMETMMQ